MTRIAFLVDGFNLYHSVMRLKGDTGCSTKWLDLDSLCRSYLPLFGRDASLASIHYFSALPYHLSPTNSGKVARHEVYLSCLKASGITVQLGRFKEKDVYCPNCKSYFLKHEEKETDVAIAVTLIELLILDQCDKAVVMSGDTDLSPAIKKCLRLFPKKSIIFAFPYARKNNELLKLAPASFSISKKQYIRHQFPNPVVLADGRKIHKPAGW